jgi:hypothetical protein
MRASTCLGIPHQASGAAADWDVTMMLLLSWWSALL